MSSGNQLPSPGCTRHLQCQQLPSTIKPPYSPLSLQVFCYEHLPFWKLKCLVYILHTFKLLLQVLGERRILFFFSFIFISWRLITLQYCSGFCHTGGRRILKWHSETLEKHLEITTVSENLITRSLSLNRIKNKKPPTSLSPKETKSLNSESSKQNTAS